MTKVAADRTEKPPVVFFDSTAAMAQWLAGNHGTTTELWVGYFKKLSGKTGISWSESVDEALCYGWIDGIRKSIDAERYTNRFTPRKQGSTWSAINIAKAKLLIKQQRRRTKRPTRA
jgi:uncharacterized protein YdeI (YjbR/CyaY-like superfamily)